LTFRGFQRKIKIQGKNDVRLATSEEQANLSQKKEAK
jgi:hypothetical protein